MCDDCKAIAAEYEYLLRNWKGHAAKQASEIEKLQDELTVERRRAADWERFSKLGLPEVMRQWIDSVIAKSQQESKL